MKGVLGMPTWVEQEKSKSISKLERYQQSISIKIQSPECLRLESTSALFVLWRYACNPEWSGVTGCSKKKQTLLFGKVCSWCMFTYLGFAWTWKSMEAGYFPFFCFSFLASFCFLSLAFSFFPFVSPMS